MGISLIFVSHRLTGKSVMDVNPTLSRLSLQHEVSSHAPISLTLKITHHDTSTLKKEGSTENFKVTLITKDPTNLNTNKMKVNNYTIHASRQSSDQTLDNASVLTFFLASDVADLYIILLQA